MHTYSDLLSSMIIYYGSLMYICLFECVVVSYTFLRRLEQNIPTDRFNNAVYSTVRIILLQQWTEYMY